VARTHGSISSFILICISGLIITVASACDNTFRGMKQDAQAAEHATRDERADASAAAREVRDDVARASRDATAVMAQAGERLAERASAARQTAAVKAALTADPSVDATRIDVDTDIHARTMTLRGFVPTNVERDMAEVIAKATVDGLAVVNSLEVRPRE
jgi:osmotically-inducible protein OsmY